MRELKFRVWNGMEMVHDVTVGRFGTFYVNPGDKGNGLDPKDSASLTPFNTKYSEETPVMQFTGREDKNGNEIYEGDVFGSSPALRCVVNQKEDGAWILSFIDERIPSISIIDSKVSKSSIIGNIYQNPELLS